MNLLLNVACSIYGAAVAEKLVDSNPFLSVERPRVQRRKRRILQPDEVGRVLAAFSDDRARRVFLTLTLTGLRRFELQGLRWRDVSFTEGRCALLSRSRRRGRGWSRSPRCSWRRSRGTS